MTLCCRSRGPAGGILYGLMRQQPLCRSASAWTCCSRPGATDAWHRGNQPAALQVSPSEARSAGMDDAVRAIGTLDARLAEMKDDYSSMCDIHNAEMRTLEAKAAACTPRGVEQARAPSLACALAASRGFHTLLCQFRPASAPPRPAVLPLIASRAPSTDAGDRHNNLCAFVPLRRCGGRRGRVFITGGDCRRLVGGCT